MSRMRLISQTATRQMLMFQVPSVHISIEPTRIVNRPPEMIVKVREKEMVGRPSETPVKFAAAISSAD